ncbi:hypothetical protein [Cohnella silvisoli]|uniref:DUF1648 domain-containing protein n=1 Tax=Cohnella silvisoli TaxID=2873699 RepID=A0ABV1L5S2_9BACL|nr:hypothetical protein [Cohnella silvisoli]MCD9026577.1 hypothetical protein [Cohnella silvisoli]
MNKPIQPFRCLAFVLVLLAAFVLFNMPTMMIGGNITTSNSTSLSHDVPNSVKATKRTSLPLNSKMLLFAELLLLVFHFRFFAYLPYRMPEHKSTFLPLVLLRLRKILLMPLKLTTSYVRI